MSLGSYLKNNRPRSIVLTIVFVLACLVFLVGIVCVFSITRMMGSSQIPQDTVNQSTPSASTDSTVSSAFQGSGDGGESVILTEAELEEANANIRARNNSLGRYPSSSGSNTTSTYYTTSGNQWYGDDDDDDYTSETTSYTQSTVSDGNEWENTSSTVSEPAASTPSEPTTSTPSEPTTSVPEEPTSTPEEPSTPSTPATSTPTTSDTPEDGTVTE